jgi:hypothetical protein
MATFVLVHGAFGSAAELAPVIPSLEALGHRGIAVDLPCADPAATLDDYARTVVEAMAGIEPGRSIADVVGADVRETMLSVSQIIPPAKQREMAARLGVEPIEIASEHAVFTFQPRELAAVLAGQGRST